MADVLRDPDAGMADNAVARHLDRRAGELLTDPRFTAWARTMAPAVAERAFLTRRLREWSTLRSLALGEPWTAEEATVRDALDLLAADGRTRRVRDAARRRLRQLPDHATEADYVVDSVVSTEAARTPVGGGCDHSEGAAGPRRRE